MVSWSVSPQQYSRKQYLNKCWLDYHGIYGSHRMNPNDFGNSLNVHLVQPVGQRFFTCSVKCQTYCRWHRHSWFPDALSQWHYWCPDILHFCLRVKWLYKYWKDCNGISILIFCTTRDSVGVKYLNSSIVRHVFDVCHSPTHGTSTIPFHQMWKFTESALRRVFFVSRLLFLFTAVKWNLQSAVRITQIPLFMFCKIFTSKDWSSNWGHCKLFWFHFPLPSVADRGKSMK